jgi:hypothetical protein
MRYDKLRAEEQMKVSKEVSVLRIVVASPGDVLGERDALRKDASRA